MLLESPWPIFNFSLLYNLKPTHQIGTPKIYRLKFFFFLIYCAILKSSACPSPKFHVLDLLLPTTFSRLKINDHHSIHKQTPKEEKSKSQSQKKTNRIDWWCSRTTVTKTHHRLFCFFFFVWKIQQNIPNRCYRKLSTPPPPLPTNSTFSSSSSTTTVNKNRQNAFELNLSISIY